MKPRAHADIYSDETIMYDLFIRIVRFFNELSIFFVNCVRFEVNCAKSHHRVISDGLRNAATATTLA